MRKREEIEKVMLEIEDFSYLVQTPLLTALSVAVLLDIRDLLTTLRAQIK